MTEKTMRQTQLSQYQRIFSDLGEYQKAYSTTYRLYQQKDTCLFMIEQQGAQAKQVQFIAEISADQAMQLVTLLYENAVSVELCQDVVSALGAKIVS